tara:strand:- start:90677 stop:92890 length:2214 start_codon:yes stop_codon:yes gene_type:complete
MKKSGVVPSLEILKSAIEQIETSVVITDKDGIIEYVNPFFSETTGFQEQEVIGTTPWLFASVAHPRAVYKDLWKTVRAGKTWNGELQNKRKDGTLIWEKVSISPVKDEDGDLTHFIALAQEIHKKKEAVLELERSERLLNDVEKVHKTGGWEYDIETGVSYWTDGLYELHGFDKNTIEDHISAGLSCIEEGDRKLIEDAFYEALMTAEGYDLTLRFEDRNGVKKWCRFKTKPLFDENGKFSKLVGTVIDVSDQVEKEKELKEITTRLEYALLGSQAGMWDWNIKSGEVIVNERWAEMVGYTLDELSPLNIETWKNLTHPEDLKKAVIELEKCFSGENIIYETNLRMKHKDGHWVWINDRGAIFERDENGDVLRMAGTHIDISEAMRQRQKLEESERRYRVLFEKSSDANLLEKEGVIIDCNQAAVTLLGYDAKEEVIGLSIEQISPALYNGRSAEVFLLENQAIAKEKGHHRFEWARIRKDGTEFPVEIMLTNLDDEEYRDTRHVVWRDLSLRKKAEAALIKSNEERGLLLGEIHHRVKNNLAIISGLMQLQVMNSEHKHELKLLNSSINRINSIADIHEQLYQSDNFSSISLSDNIRKQVKSLSNMYSVENGINIEVKLDLGEVFVNINQALPVGLLINEILNNSYKYAFNGVKEGEIYIRLHDDSDRIYLHIGDNGTGIHFSESEKNESLGQTLINTFIKQLDADAEITVDDGVSYHISFMKSSKKGSLANSNIS